MNKFFALPALLSLFFLSQAAQAQIKFVLLPDKSELHWKAETIMGGGHEGTLQLTSGSIIINAKREIAKGDFVIDMNAMDTEIRPKEKGRELEDHLKSDDFFAVAKFPKAFFSIIKVTPVVNLSKPDQYTVVGYLGIKTITNQIAFPATITISKDIVTAQADIVIDRTKWDITYQSKTILTNLKDGAIADEIRISLNLIFKSTTKGIAE